MHYVLLEGIFNSKDRGHMGMWSGSLTKIQRAEVWDDKSKRPRLVRATELLSSYGSTI
jgi:hypothetical protein